MTVVLLALGAGVLGGRLLSQKSADVAETASAPPLQSAVPLTGAPPMATPAQLTQPSVTPAATSSRRPEFSLLDMNRVRRNINEWDDTIVVVNFWATWCGPCRTEIPGFNRLQQKYATKNVTFIGVAFDDPEAIKNFMQSTPIDYPVLFGDDEVMEISMRYGNLNAILPYTAFIDRRGNIAKIVEGGLDEADAEEYLKALF